MHLWGTRIQNDLFYPNRLERAPGSFCGCASLNTRKVLIFSGEASIKVFDGIKLAEKSACNLDFCFAYPVLCNNFSRVRRAFHS